MNDLVNKEIRPVYNVDLVKLYNRTCDLPVTSGNDLLRVTSKEV